MKRILSLVSASAIMLAFALTGCDNSGGAGEGVPKGVGYVAPAPPPGAPAISTDMTKFGNKPPAKGADKKAGDDAAKTPAAK